MMEMEEERLRMREHVMKNVCLIYLICFKLVSPRLSLTDADCLFLLKGGSEQRSACHPGGVPQIHREEGVQ